MRPLAIRAVVFDIGGVLEYTPPTGMTEKWEQGLGLQPGELHDRLGGVWASGNVGAISEQQVHTRIGELLELDEARVHAFMADVWAEYLGTLNAELAQYFSRLRPRYRTAMLSNSFVGARCKEQERYGFGDMTDLIVYSHELGMSKPDPRIYEVTCERLGVQPAEAIFLDDVEEMVSGAEQVGMRAILFGDNAQGIADVEALLRATRPAPRTQRLS